jgi:hypothetical protein
MNATIADYTKRTRQYWWIDGLAEIAFGLQLGLLTVYHFLTIFFSSLGWGVAAAFLGIVFIVVGFLTINKGLLWVKERITFPRTGYVKYPNKRAASRRRRIFIAIGIGSITSILVNLSLATLGPAAQWTVIALIMMSCLIYVAYFSGVSRYYVMGILSFVWGVGMNWIPFNTGSLYAWFFGGLGCLFIFTGLIVFLGYLRRYPVLEGAEDAG